MVPPVGYGIVSPGTSTISLDNLSADTTVDFALGCPVDVSGTVFSNCSGPMAGVMVGLVLGDDSDYFPASIFSHFHENGFNAIAVEGVTFMAGETGPIPLNLETIQSTLTVNGGQNTLARAKQHYLSLLLNLASGNLMTFTPVSEDGRTASQALQYIAALINDGDGANDNLAKDISEAMNEAQLLDAGVIPEDYVNIAYRWGEGGLPLNVALAQNTPNPFNPMTKIAFFLPEEQRVQIGIYAPNGRRIATLVNEVMAQGTHEAVWTGRDGYGRPVASGVYFYRLDTGDFRETKRMMLVR